MNEEKKLPEPTVKSKTKISNVWALPLVALAIGVWMIYNEWQNRGATITVSFDTAEGLVAGKTPIKYRNVDVGLVEEIGFNTEKSAILLSVEIEKPMIDLLKQDTSFWVVRPRIGADGISGISTLLSGAYIELSPGTTGSRRDLYEGLERPPLTPPNADGLHLTLSSSGGKPLGVGNPVLYEGFKVGKIESYVFDPITRTATYQVFIQSPYDALVTTNTFFWNASGVNITAGAEGFQLDIASLDTLLGGGIQFGIPEGLDLGSAITQSRDFELYDSLDAVRNRREYAFTEYVVLVEDSVGGLYRGASVEYRGIRIGTVSEPYLKLDTTLEGVGDLVDDPRIPIILKIEPGRIYDNQMVDPKEFDLVIESGIKEGLAASIESANLLTGSLKVSLNFVKENQNEIEKFGAYTVIPFNRSGFANIGEKVEDLLGKLNKLPLDQTTEALNQVLMTTDGTLQSLESAIFEFEETLSGLKPHSELYQNLNSSLEELKFSLREAQPFLNNISEKPNSLIFSKKHSLDKEPAINKQP